AQERDEAFDVLAAPGGEEAQARHDERSHIVERDLRPRRVAVDDQPSLVQQAQPGTDEYGNEGRAAQRRAAQEHAKGIAVGDPDRWYCPPTVDSHVRLLLERLRPIARPV